MTSDNVTTDRVAHLIERMTLSEKVGQMTQVELGSITPDEVAIHGIGSILSGGGGNPGDGSASAWREGVESFIAGSRRSRLGIPILYGTDAVHGHNNVLGATIFPHNIGLGAANSPDLMREVSRAAALETAATGARWAFAPCLAVPQDPRWGRTYEGFSQDPDRVSSLGRAAVEGWQGHDLPASGVLACAKHFIGEGAMKWGTAGRHRHPWNDWWDGWAETWGIDQGDIVIDETELRRVHLAPFVAAIEAGVVTVMACYATWRDERIHGHRYLLTDLLKDELGFTGFVVSDWMGVDQLDADWANAVDRAINAGVDMVMVPFDHQRFITTTLELVRDGRISESRIDDAVRRILCAKDTLGVLAAPSSRIPIEFVGCDQHRRLGRTAAAASVVALTNEDALPIIHGPVLSAGRGLDDIGLACGGWTITWEGAAGPITEGRTILDGLRRHLGGSSVVHDPDGAMGSATAPYGVVSIHEEPYVEGGGDRADLSISEAQVGLVQSMRERVETLIVVVISGRPLVLEPIVELADAILACWLPGSEADGIADVLVGASPVRGTLPIVWPRSMGQVTGQQEEASPPPWPIGHTAIPIVDEDNSANEPIEVATS